MNPKFRFLYLIGGTIGLVTLFYQGIVAWPDVDPVRVLIIAIPDMVLFFLAYKTYPAEPVTRPQESYQQRKVSNY
jgi:hypothetical protein